MFKHTTTYDKWRHLISGVPMGLVIYLAAMFLAGKQYAWGISILLVVVISLGFEALSLIIKRGTAEWLDALFSIIGGLIGICLAWVLWPYLQ